MNKSSNFLYDCVLPCVVVLILFLVAAHLEYLQTI